MSTDLFKQVLFNDGEETTFGDLNDQENFADAMLTDQILESLVGNFTLTGVDTLFSGSVQANAANHLAYCLHGGSAYLRLGSAANKIQIAPGVLFQKVANKDGNASTFLPYYFDGSSAYEFTIAAGSASPRVDLLQMSLAMVSGSSQLRDFKDATTGAITSQTMNKKRQVNCTISVKQGTPAATPTVPDPDAGYVAVGCVVVHNTYTGSSDTLGFGLNTATSVAGSHAAVWDQRMPMRMHSMCVKPRTMYAKTAWAVGAGLLLGEDQISSSTTNELLVDITPGYNTGRLVSLFFDKDITAWNATTSKFSGSQISAQVIPSLNTASNYLAIPYYSWEGITTIFGSGVNITASTTNKIGAPIWSNGLRCATPRAATQVGMPYLFLDLVSGNNLSHIIQITANWAG